jgi:hypothetical protein
MGSCLSLSRTENSRNRVSKQRCVVEQSTGWRRTGIDQATILHGAGLILRLLTHEPPLAFSPADFAKPSKRAGHGLALTDHLFWHWRRLGCRRCIGHYEQQN